MVSGVIWGEVMGTVRSRCSEVPMQDFGDARTGRKSRRGSEPREWHSPASHHKPFEIIRPNYRLRKPRRSKNLLDRCNLSNDESFGAFPISLSSSPFAHGPTPPTSPHHRPRPTQRRHGALRPVRSRPPRPRALAVGYLISPL